MLDIQEILHSFERLKVLVVGDIMLDHYIFGAVNRISPEAPVPIVDIVNEKYCAGGAANVALNIQALGATPFLCSTIGDDEAGATLVSCLGNQGIDTAYIQQSTNRKTTCKQRVLSQGQHLFRLDTEDKHTLSAADCSSLLIAISSIVETYSIDIILFQDYNKGVLFPTTIQAILNLAKQNKILTAVDPKADNFYVYKEVDLFKPNLREIAQQVPFKVIPTLDALQKATNYIGKRLSNKETLITLSEKGLYYQHDDSAHLVPTTPRKISDVCGAGDTVISVAALGLAINLDRLQLSTLCNLAGGQVCEKIGVTPVSKDLLIEDVQESLNLGGKIKN